MFTILVLPYVINRVRQSDECRKDFRASAASGLALVFLFTASGHFLQTDVMVMMLPPWVPARETLIYATGLLEVGIAVALFFRRSRACAATIAAISLIAFYPANVYAALERVPMGDHAWGPAYLLIRTPLQLFLVWWAWAMVIRIPSKHENGSSEFTSGENRY